jgi:molybdopterin-containing oxidoreductase family membrane subunit
MWSDYRPTLIEVTTFIGTLGLFFTLFMLFCRFVPVIAIAEIKGVLRPGHAGGHEARPGPPGSEHAGAAKGATSR